MVDHLTKRMTDLAEVAASCLMGTCGMLSTVLDDLDECGADNNTDFCHRLDALVFECSVCGWWCDTDALHDGGDGGEMRCEGCASDESED